ncbi:hypothetical protein CAPTEDRAFT_228557 [Capitella teleta]|uniref:Uncharacterized protein n=1 Tax=Capitella teleta TaxID=283909 RepID=R7U5C6_CAPTE|nr:hypothetical protein CAPTEDRAFT_228557 [Capitella teleta]|eukprot:ELU01321.1 hypothetical protein CAPTEDRAFT_228557 [Capitella teleta]
MACGREERSDCCDSKTKSDQYGECIDESFEYTRNEEENDRTRDAGTEYGGANVDNANQWIVLWNPVVSKLNEMRPDPPARIAHTSIFADLCFKMHVLEVAHVYYQTQCGNLAQSRINNAYLNLYHVAGVVEESDVDYKNAQPRTPNATSVERRDIGARFCNTDFKFVM